MKSNQNKEGKNKKTSKKIVTSEKNNNQKTKQKKTDEKLNAKLEAKNGKNEVAKVNFKESEEKKKKDKLKRNLVIVVLTIAVLIIYVIQRGEYLEIKEIGARYIPMFWTNFRAMLATAVLNFSIVFLAIYFATKKIKEGLKPFFDDENKEMPKLPQKSISFIIATLITIITSNMLMENALLCLYHTKFVITDPALGNDIGFYVFILPFIKLLVTYALVLLISITIYSALYYLLVFNLCFDGIRRETVSKSIILNQVLFAIKAIVFAFGILIMVETENIGVQKFITLNSNESLNYVLYGAGSTEIYIRFAAYILLSFVITFSTFKAIKNFKRNNTKKLIKSILIVPAYLVIVFITMISYSLVFVNSNELDKERKYINDNIKYTKMAYGIDIENVKISDEGTISENEINENTDTINNIPIVNSDIVLKDLNTSLTNDDYYKYMYTNQALYAVDGKNQLLFITPREIQTEDSEYSNKTYEYTHGYGVIATSANTMTASGNLNHIQKSFEETNEALKISQPRIYFGRETNSIVVTNSPSKKEFDYPLSTSENAENDYHGEAGLRLNLLDRIILAIKEKDSKLALSGGVKSDSKILTNRNIINRAKTIMPYLLYDENPYIVVRNDGELVWILDAYTVTNEYPYSQRTILEDNGLLKTEINYIRNSVKVIINAYSGEVTFYATDKNDPILAVYQKIYPELFSSEKIPEDITAHLVYPSYLYKIQSKIVERYHDIEADDLYRSDDVWEAATHNATQISSKKGTTINPYYSMVKTADANQSRLGLILPYTPYNKENIVAYLIGSVDEDGNSNLKTYIYSKENNVVGPMQLDAQISKDETIAKELETLNIAGTKIIKNIVIVPINNSTLYVEPIYQQYVNDEESLPVLKKVIIASGNKVTVGDTYSEAIKNLISQNAIDIELKNPDDIEDLLNAIIKANNNLKESTQSGDWSQMGKDTQKLQELITKMEEVKVKEDQKKLKETSKDEEDDEIEEEN